MTAIVQFIVLTALIIFLVVPEMGRRKRAKAYHMDKMREYNMKGEKELANYHLEQLVRAQQGKGGYID